MHVVASEGSEVKVQRPGWIRPSRPVEHKPACVRKTEEESSLQGRESTVCILDAGRAPDATAPKWCAGVLGGTAAASVGRIGRHRAEATAIRG